MRLARLLPHERQQILYITVLSVRSCHTKSKYFCDSIVFYYTQPRSRSDFAPYIRQCCVVMWPNIVGYGEHG